MNVRPWILTVGMLVVPLFLVAGAATAGGKVGVYGIRMEPGTKDADDFSAPGWGGGLHVVVPVPQLWNILAFVGGGEIVNLLSETVTFSDGFTGLRAEQQTDQNYLRVFLGAQVGGHGNGFLRPHAGLNLALINYGIKTDVVVPDDSDRENDIRQNLRSEHHWATGYDITLGVDLNFSNSVMVDGGIRYLKSFSVPQQLGADSITIHPDYVQIYLGVGISFEKWRKVGKGD